MITQLQQHDKFADFSVPVDSSNEFRDATYFLRNDGTFVFAEGYCHTFDRPFEEQQLVSHIVFVPRKGDVPEYGHKTLFGQPYMNLTKLVMNTEPLDRFYPVQLQKYLETDPSLDQPRPSYARYKVFVPVRSLVSCFPHRHAMRAIWARGDAGDERAARIKRAIFASAELLDIPPERIGMSGSLSLGTYDNPHDLDIVIYGTVAENRRLIDFIYNLTAADDERKVFEFGKFWPLRFWETVDDTKLMICPFFSYLDLEECPLRDFSCEERDSVSFSGRVCDHTHNAYNPTILMLDEVAIEGKTRQDEMRLIMYHGGERGDYVEGDRVEGNASRVIIRTCRGRGDARRQVGEYEALLTTNIGQVSKTVES